MKTGNPTETPISQNIKLPAQAMLAAVLAMTLCGTGAHAEEIKPAAVAAATPAVAAIAPATPQARGLAAIDKAQAFLRFQQQPDTGWQMKPTEPPALTAIVIKALARNGKTADNKAAIDNALAHLVTLEKPDGSVGESLVTYNTAIVASALAVVNDPKYQPQLDKAIAYLRGAQLTDKIQGVARTSNITEQSDINYGGWNYGQKGRDARGDNSNLQMAVDALHDAGLKNDDPAFQAAVVFASRSQNLSEKNPQPWAGDDGGFIYTPAEGGRSAAGETTGPDGHRMLRSYGAMTYAGLKSMMYAGLSKDDPRVKAAWGWVQNNWTLDEHPGLAVNPKNANGGMFYYYHTMARALHAYGQPIIVDAKGKSHDWRLELIDKLVGTQNVDGSWVGTQRWMENRPVLASALGVLSLQEALADLQEHPAK